MPDINATLTDMQVRQLTAELPRGVTHTLPHKGNLDYLERGYIVTRLNQIFGFDSWDLQVRETWWQDDPQSETCTATAAVRLLIWTDRQAGVVLRRDGTGVCGNKARVLADRLDTALKGAVSDAFKRAAVTLGSQFAVLQDNPTRQDARYWQSDPRAAEAVQARKERAA